LQCAATWDNELPEQRSGGTARQSAAGG
jgi:hypothetical protein